MEAVVLLGLIGAGYLVNKTNEDSIPQEINVNKDINFPNGDNIYHSEQIDKNKKMIQSRLASNYEEAQNQNSKLINPLNPKRNLSFPQKDLKEGYDNLSYSNASGGYICQDEFLTNDQGISVAPFFSGSGANINFDDSRQLSRSQGGNDFYENKKELAPMFFPGSRNNFFRGITEPTRILEFLDFSNVHCLVLLWVTAPCIEMKAPGALESCDFGLSKITSVPR